MLNAIRICDERFDMEQNTLAELTDNTIILCRNFDMMSALAGDIVRAINKKGDYYDYICEDEDIGKALAVITTISANSNLSIDGIQTAFPQFLFTLKCGQWINLFRLLIVRPPIVKEPNVFNALCPIHHCRFQTQGNFLPVDIDGFLQEQFDIVQWISDHRKHRAVL